MASEADWYWERLVKANPTMLGDDDNGMEMEVGSFKRQIIKAFQAGQENEKAKRKAAEDFKRVADSYKKSSVEDIFGGLFR